MAAASCLALAGCGTGAGARARPPAAPGSDRAKLALAQATHEYPSSTQPQQGTTSLAPTPRVAIATFASAYINWSAQTVARHMRALAAASIGQARSAMQLAAAQTAQDYELQRAGIANHGVVETIAPLAGTHGRYVVVTRERTTAIDTTAYQGLVPAWHVTIATVAQVAGGGWVVSGWQPES
jgi:hypothetical protein